MKLIITIYIEFTKNIIAKARLKMENVSLPDPCLNYIKQQMVIVKVSSIPNLNHTGPLKSVVILYK